MKPKKKKKKAKVRFTTSHLCVNQEKVPAGMATGKTQLKNLATTVQMKVIVHRCKFHRNSRGFFGEGNTVTEM